MFLVTGGAGFIGSHLATQLRAGGSAVRVFDNFSTGRQSNLDGVPKPMDVMEADLRDAAAVRAAMDGISAVFHLAAEPSVPRSIADPTTTYDINVGGTLNVLIAARDAGVRRVVFASSSAIYGENPESPKHERMVAAPISPYASSKYAGEDLCRVFTAAYGLETVSLRFFNVYGPRQDPHSAYAAVIPKFVDAITRGEAPVIFGDGEQTRDFVYVGDVVDALIRASQSPAAIGHVYNVASGRAVSVNAMYREIARIFGSSLEPVHADPRPGDIRHSLADVSAASRDLGFSASTAFADGISRTIETATFESAIP